MKKVILTINLVLCFVTGVVADSVSVIPQPQSMELKKGSFTFPSSLTISAPTKHHKAVKELAKILSKNGINVKLVKSNGTIGFGGLKTVMEDEQYYLSVRPKRISIIANEPTGAFYAVQTLRQLLPPEVVTNTADLKTVKLPCLKIKDKPRFSWRAFMLDESRHFKGMKQVKKLLDQMAQLKMNVFHWHLTDDQGWRIEIKKYPRLTSFGSKRADTQTGGWGSPTRSGEPHEGFYTQEEIKEIVKYAADRHITIIPEIGMPGHATAAIASYPWLGCKKVEIEMPVTFGKHYHTFDVSDPKVMQFFSDVFDEVFELFPSKIIHIGGDEVRFNHWKESKAITDLKEKYGLNGYADVQVNFTNQISEMVEKKNHSIMGWNEIMGHNVHGSINGHDNKKVTAKLSTNTIVHFWKGSGKLATEAIKKGHKVVNSWHSFTYLDYGYGSISLKKAFDFNPIFPGLEEKYHDSVLGLGCQMWSEWIPTVERMDYQIFPRIAAYAEAGWTELESKDWNDFKVGMRKQLKRWDLLGIHYAKDQVSQVTASDFFNYQKVGSWTPSQVSTEFQTLSFDITAFIKAAGEVTVAPIYTKGAHAVDIAEASILENGKKIATDKHDGFSGATLKNVVYKLNLRKFSADKKYSLELKLKGNGGNQTYGDVKISVD